MKWNNLAKNQCPECGKYLISFENKTLSCKCGFSISEEKFKKVISGELIPEAEKKEKKDVEKILDAAEFTRVERERRRGKFMSKNPDRAVDDGEPRS